MGPEFIFSRDIEDLVREGKKTIEVGEEVRISAAARDLIREHRDRDDLQPDQETPPAPINHGRTRVETRRKPLGQKAGPEAEKGPGPEQRIKPLRTARRHGQEEELERIVNRVIERFKELKGRRTSPKPEQTGSPRLRRRPDHLPLRGDHPRGDQGGHPQRDANRQRN